MTDDPRAGSEAARLFAAAQDWLRTSAPHFAPTDVDGSPCSCPVCRVVAGVRDADPDDVARFVASAVAAVSSLATQATDLAAAAREQGATWSSPEAWTGDDDARGYAVDVDEDMDDLDVEDEDEADDGAGADDEPRTVRRIRLDGQD